MKSRWMLAERMNRGTREYGVYRMLDRDKPDHGDNREYRGFFTRSRRAAQNTVDYLNDVDERGSA